VRFYCDILGLREATRFTFGDEQLVFLAAGSGWVELVYDGGREEDRSRVAEVTKTDLVPPKEEDRSRIPEGKETRRAGVVDHFALRVDDLDATAERLRQRDVQLLDERPLEVAELNARILFCLGPDGERIELIERR